MSVPKTHSDGTPVLKPKVIERERSQLRLKRCPYCDGAGSVFRFRSDRDLTECPCPVCHGAGYLDPDVITDRVKLAMRPQRFIGMS